MHVKNNVSVPCNSRKSMQSKYLETIQKMQNSPKILFHTGASLDLDNPAMTLGELIERSSDILVDDRISAEGFGPLKFFFFVNQTRGTLIDDQIALDRPLSTLPIAAGDQIELRLCDPPCLEDGVKLNPMFGVTRFAS